jgi:6-phosphofructokinase 1
MSKKKKILILTGGGDAPGLNAVIRAAVRHAIITHGWECIGSIEAFNGVLDDPMRIMPLNEKTVSGLLMRGGTIIGTTNKGGPFEFPITDQNGNITVVDRSDQYWRRWVATDFTAIV